MQTFQGDHGEVPKIEKVTATVPSSIEASTLTSVQTDLVNGGPAGLDWTKLDQTGQERTVQDRTELNSIYNV